MFYNNFCKMVYEEVTINNLKTQNMDIYSEYLVP